MSESKLQEIKVKSDEILAKSIPNNGVPGARFLAIGRDGNTIYSGLAGTIGMDDTRPMTNDTIFYMASCTKLLTAMCAMQCVEQGLITLDESILPHLPELKQQVVYADFGTREPKFVPREKDITLRDLLTMTAGCSYPMVDILYAQGESIPAGKYPFMRADKSAYVGPLECQPGTKWAYSGCMDWAGALVETLSGMTLGDFLKKNILEPCDVQEITFEITSDMKTRLVGAHFRWPDGRVSSRGPIAPLDDVQAHLGGQGTFGTADAFAQILLPLINEGTHPTTKKQILTPESVKEMFRGQLNEQQHAWLEKPTFANQMRVMLPGVEKQWGLGFLLTPKGTPSGRGPGTGTWGGLANTHWVVDPHSGVVMVVFAQLLPYPDDHLMAVRDEWETALYSSILA